MIHLRGFPAAVNTTVPPPRPTVALPIVYCFRGTFVFDLLQVNTIFYLRLIEKVFFEDVCQYILNIILSVDFFLTLFVVRRIFFIVIYVFL